MQVPVREDNSTGEVHYSFVGGLMQLLEDGIGRQTALEDRAIGLFLSTRRVRRVSLLLVLIMHWAGAIWRAGLSGTGARAPGLPK